MKINVSLIMIFVTAISYTALAEEPVYFADASIKQAVEEALGVTDPSPIDMLGLTSLSARNRGISNLAGLEYARNLQELSLGANHINDRSPLSRLTSLQNLNLSNNRISDISPLSGLTSLRDLGLQGNQISDLSPLSGLTRLQYLNRGGYRNRDTAAV